MRAEEQQQQESKTGLQGSSLLVTNLIKLGGLLVALNEVFVRPEIRSGGIALAALMMAGAQSLETFLTSFFGGGQKR